MMKCEPFARHFPITYSHVDKFIKGVPHERYSNKKSKTGRKVCRILLLKKTALLPISISFLTCFSSMLAFFKFMEMTGRIFTLLNPTNKHFEKFILASKQVTDYVMLSCFLPIKSVAEIIKLTTAVCFGSHFYFSPVKAYSLKVQIAYYQKNTNQNFYQFYFEKNVTLQIKAEIREIEHVYEKIITELEGKEKIIVFLKRFIKLLRKISISQIISKDLDHLRSFCQKTADENDIKVAFKAPKTDLYSCNSSIFYSCDQNDNGFGE